MLDDLSHPGAPGDASFQRRCRSIEQIYGVTEMTRLLPCACAARSLPLSTLGLRCVRKDGKVPLLSRSFPVLVFSTGGWLTQGVTQVRTM